MTATREIHWLRVFVEGVVIVGRGVGHVTQSSRTFANVLPTDALN